MRFFVPIPCTPARIRYSSGRGWRLGIHAGPFARVYTHGKQTKVYTHGKQTNVYTVPDTSFSMPPWDPFKPIKPFKF